MYDILSQSVIAEKKKKNCLLSVKQTVFCLPGQTANIILSLLLKMKTFSEVCFVLKDQESQMLLFMELRNLLCFVSPYDSAGNEQEAQDKPLLSAGVTRNTFSPNSW